jgi:hypothetical protein
MSGADRQIYSYQKWITKQISVGTSVTEITDIVVNDKTTIMIQSASINTGKVYFGADDTITSGGVGNIGGELEAKQSAVLPLQLFGNSRLFVVGSAGSQILYVSIWDAGQIV